MSSKLAFCRADTDFDDGVYTMEHAKRGVFLIINNRNFDALKERYGTDWDAANLYEVFTGLGFDVRMENNKKKREMREILCEGMDGLIVEM